jgi:hypothetical protein
MKILFDNGTPKPIARCLTGHEITYARQIGVTKAFNPREVGADTMKCGELP